MTRLRTFVPDAATVPYRVICMVNKWDEDEGRITVQINTAIGPIDARHLAEEQLRDRYPSVLALRAEQV